MLRMLLSGIGLGAIYGVAAIGWSMIWRSARLINFAQGDLSMISAFFGLVFVQQMSLPIWVAGPIILLLMGIAGAAAERLLLRRVMDAPFFSGIAMTLGISVMLVNFATVQFGAHSRPFPAHFGRDPVAVFGTRVFPDTLGAVVFGIISMVALHFFLQYTWPGRAMRATAQDKGAALLAGVRVDRMVMLSVAVAFMLAAGAGLLLAPLTLVAPSMGLLLGLTGFTAAVIGGFGSVKGAIAGGFAVGFLDVIVTTYLTTQFKNVAIFTLLIVFLMFRPTGIYGEYFQEKM